MIGIVAGAAVGTVLPKYKAIEAKPIVYTLAETGFNAARGAATGVVCSQRVCPPVSLPATR